MSASHVDAAALQAHLGELALAPFAVHGEAIRRWLEVLASQGGQARVMPSARHAGLSLPGRVVAVDDEGLLLRAAVDADLVHGNRWREAVADAALGHHILRFPLPGLRAAAHAAADPADSVLLRCALPPVLWRIHRREVFRAPASESLPLWLHAQRRDGTWLRAALLDLSIAGLAFEVCSEHAPLAVDELLIGAQVLEGPYRSPVFELTVRHVAASPELPGVWRVGAALQDPPRDVVCSLQLTTYRLERAQRDARQG